MQRPSRKGDLKSICSGPVIHLMSYVNPLVHLNIIFNVTYSTYSMITSQKLQI